MNKIVSVNKARYGQIKDIAFDFLLDRNFEKFPFNINKIIKKLGYKIIYSIKNNSNCFDKFEIESSIISDHINKNNIIYINKKYKGKRKVFSKAHEIGHLVLGHIESTEISEKEANYFAKMILIPLPTLFFPYIKEYIEDVEKISLIYNVSKELASYAIEHYKKISCINFRNDEKFKQLYKHLYKLLETRINDLKLKNLI